VVPPQVLVVPLFAEMVSLGLVDTYWAIILPQAAAPIMVYILKKFFDGLPRELEESALIDGASRLRIYWQIVMPLSRRCSPPSPSSPSSSPGTISSGHSWSPPIRTR